MKEVLISVDETHVCSKCKIRKNVSEFYVDRSKKNIKVSFGYISSSCKVCESERKKNIRLENGEEMRRKERENRKDPSYRSRLKAYYEASKEKYNDRRNKKWASRNSDDIQKNAISARYRYIKRTYGMTPEYLDSLVKLSGGRCKVCRCKFTKTGLHALRVDHCHSSGHVRGIICDRCNVVEGLCGSPSVLEKIIKYMEKNSLLSYSVK